MIKTVHLLTFSPCGGTSNVMKAVGRDIALPIQEHDITLPKNRVQEMHFTQDDLVIMGFPVYGGRMPLFFASLIAHLKGTNTPMAMVAVYGNRAYEGAFLDMHEAANANGFKPVAAIAAIAEHSVAPHIATGRPDSDDQEKLAEFGLRALDAAQKGPGMFIAPGAYPTWTLPPELEIFAKANTETCTGCGYCVSVCPNGAIPSDAPQSTIAARCIACTACIKYCPAKARRLGDPTTMKELATHLLYATQRKDAEIFE